MKNICRSYYYQFIVGLLTIFLLTATYAPAQKRSRNVQSISKDALANEQTSFSSEKRISSRIEIPPLVMTQLAAFDDGQLGKCQQDESLRQKNAADHFAAAQIKLNGDSHDDLIVQAQTACFRGAHNTTFWIFVADDSSAGYQMVFNIAVDFLQVLKKSTSGYRDLQTASHTANELYTTVWKFDGQKYYSSECRVRSGSGNRSIKIKCRV